MFLKSQPYDVNVITHIEPPHSVKRLYEFSFQSYEVSERTSICFKMTVENFVRIVVTVFEKIEKGSQLAVLWSISAVSRIPVLRY